MQSLGSQKEMGVKGDSMASCTGSSISGLEVEGRNQGSLWTPTGEQQGTPAPAPADPPWPLTMPNPANFRMRLLWSGLIHGEEGRMTTQR